jgi:hypothetical protein
MDQTEYLTMLRYWFGTMMIKRSTKYIPRTYVELVAMRGRYDVLSLDEVFNRSIALANLEIFELMRRRVNNLTPFSTAVVERILDRQYPSAFPPLDRATLRAYKPPTMFNGTEYSKEDCDRIHRDMKVEQIQDDFTEFSAALIRSFKLKSLEPDSLEELMENCTREVEENFTLKLALRRYERTRG